jgi:hypothetical protein
MTSLIVLIAISLGAALTLIGLLLIAPEVKVHQIRVYSPGSWVFRAGMALTLIGLMGVWANNGAQELRQVGLVVGVAGAMGGVITWGHEWRQAHETGHTRWDWPRSLTLQMVVLGLLTIGLALVIPSP